MRCAAPELNRCVDAAGYRVAQAAVEKAKQKKLNLVAGLIRGKKAGDALAVLSSPDYGQALADARKARADAQVAAQRPDLRAEHRPESPRRTEA